MKTAYHTFEFKNRTITICATEVETKPGEVKVDPISCFKPVFEIGTPTNILVGYSVCVPEDKFQASMSRDISMGRAKSKNRLAQYFVSPEILNYGTVKGIAKMFESKIKSGEVEIKGIRDKKKVEALPANSN